MCGIAGLVGNFERRAGVGRCSHLPQDIGIVFNGAIHNFRELRKELEAQGGEAGDATILDSTARPQRLINFI